MLSISKQAHAQHQIKEVNDSFDKQAILNKIAHVRIKHPVMGLKKLYHKIKPINLGRDQFIDLAMSANLGVKMPRNYSRTTFSTKSNRYHNLLEDLFLDDINQVWVSDITYFWVIDKFYYLTFIMDLYSRQIVGFKASDTLSASANVETLQMAIKYRKGHDLTKLIHHSDKGTQYVYSQYISLLESINANISLCNTVYENSHSERLNGIIKNEYLKHRNIHNLAQLEKQLARDVKLYNYDRPHLELNLMTPIEYEYTIKSIPQNQRNKMKIFVDKQTIYKQKFANQLVLF